MVISCVYRYIYTATIIISSCWWFQPLWKILVSWDDYSQNMENVFQTTNQSCIYIYTYIHTYIHGYYHYNGCYRHHGEYGQYIHIYTYICIIWLLMVHNGGQDHWILPIIIMFILITSYYIDSPNAGTPNGTFQKRLQQNQVHSGYQGIRSLNISGKIHWSENSMKFIWL